MTPAPALSNQAPAGSQTDDAALLSRARINDQTYQNYDGPLRTRAARWWVVALALLRTRINRKSLGFWALSAILLVIYLFCGISMYFLRAIYRISIQAGGEPPPFNLYTFVLNNGLAWSCVFLFLTALTIGAGSIASDNRANALLVYLSKPLTRADYVLGKWMGIFLPLAGLSCIPAVLLYFFFLVSFGSEGFWSGNPTLLYRTVAATLIGPAVLSSLIVGISAFTRSPRTAGTIFAAIYFVSFSLTASASYILGSRDKTDADARRTATVAAMSVEGLIRGVGANLYGIEPQQMTDAMTQGRRRRRASQRGAPPPPPSPSRMRVGKAPLAPLLIASFLLILVPPYLAYRKVRAVEIVSG